MYNIYEHKMEYNDYILDIEVYYNKLDNKTLYLGHTFFVLKDNKVLEEYPEGISEYVDSVMNDICDKIE